MAEVRLQCTHPGCKESSENYGLQRILEHIALHLEKDHNLWSQYSHFCANCDARFACSWYANHHHLETSKSGRPHTVRRMAAIPNHNNAKKMGPLLQDYQKRYCAVVNGSHPNREHSDRGSRSHNNSQVYSPKTPRYQEDAEPPADNRAEPDVIVSSDDDEPAGPFERLFRNDSPPYAASSILDGDAHPDHIRGVMTEREARQAPPRADRSSSSSEDGQADAGCPSFSRQKRQSTLFKKKNESSAQSSYFAGALTRLGQQHSTFQCHHHRSVEEMARTAKQPDITPRKTPPVNVPRPIPPSLYRQNYLGRSVHRPPRRSTTPGQYLNASTSDDEEDGPKRKVARQ